MNRLIVFDPSNVRSTYDDEADVLYISFGEPRPHVCREDRDFEGFHYCHALDDGTLCGATVVWYSDADKDALRRKLPGVRLPG